MNRLILAIAICMLLVLSVRADDNICPQCGKVMIREQGDGIYTSYPPQRDERWWCGCGYRGIWERVQGKRYEEVLKDEWEKTNREQEEKEEWRLYGLCQISPIVLREWNDTREEEYKIKRKEWEKETIAIYKKNPDTACNKKVS